jgi:hypothetical protein
MRTLLGPRRVHRLVSEPARPAVAVGFGRPGFEAPTTRVGLTATLDDGAKPGAVATKAQLMTGVVLIAGVGAIAGAGMGWLLPATVGRIALGALAGGASVLALPVVATVFGGDGAA